MWEKCGTYSRRERAQGAVRHVLPQAGGGVWGGGGDTIGGGGGGRRTRNRDHISRRATLPLNPKPCTRNHAPETVNPKP